MFVIAYGTLFCDYEQPIQGARILVLVVADAWSCLYSFLRLRAPLKLTKTWILRWRDNTQQNTQSSRYNPHQDFALKN